MRIRSIRLPIVTVLLFALGLMLALRFAMLPHHAGATPSHGSPGFTTQARLGFAAGDDWEPAIATDRYGHVYALYKHNDVAGQMSCSSCDLHLLLQVSGDRGRTWSQPRAIDPEVVQAGQYDPQIAVDPVDGKTIWVAFLQKSKSSIAVMKSPARNG